MPNFVYRLLINLYRTHVEVENRFKLVLAGPRQTKAFITERNLTKHRNHLVRISRFHVFEEKVKERL